MTIAKAKKMYPNLKIYSSWAKVQADNLATMTTLKRIGKYDKNKELKPVGVMVSRVSRDAHYFIYEIPQN